MSFIERLLELLAEKRITKNKLLSDLKINKSAILNWTNNGNVPKGETLRAIAEYLDVSIDYLIGASDDKKNKSAVGGELIDNKPVNPRVAEITKAMSQMDAAQSERFYKMFCLFFDKPEK